MRSLILAVLLALSLLASAAHAQLTTCVTAVAAKPMGPFPCSVTATWQDNSTDETGFVLERRLNGGAWTVLGGPPLGVNVTSVVDATLQQSATVDNLYEYRVAAVNAGGQSGYSNLASFTVPKAVPLAPKPPSTLTITFDGATGQIKLANKNTINLKNQTGTMTLIGAISVVDFQ